MLRYLELVLAVANLACAKVIENLARQDRDFLTTTFQRFLKPT
jgi:hypothetical protein